MISAADHHILRLGHALTLLDHAALRRMHRPLAEGRRGEVADTLHSYVREVRRLSASHAQMELRRSYAGAPDQLFTDEDDLADEYADYLVDLVGALDDDLKVRVGESLAASAKGGEDTNRAARRLGQVLRGFKLGRLRTIVRTESGRVVAHTRQQIAQRALESGLGPAGFLFSAILDERTTDTCRHGGHGHFYLAGDTGPWATEWAPFHYNCRSIYRFLYDGDPEFAAATPWTPDAWERFKAIQAREFPGWVTRAA